MSNFQKIYLTVLVLLALATVAVGAAYHLQDRQDIQKESETANWNTYRNEEFGFEFKYPQEFEVVQDEFYYDEELDIKEHSVVIINNNINDSILEHPRLTIRVNGFGIGPIFDDKYYNIDIAENGSLNIVSIKDNEDEFGEGVVQIISVFEDDEGNFYRMFFDFQEGGNDFEPLFQQILSTFRFVE